MRKMIFAVALVLIALPAFAGEFPENKKHGQSPYRYEVNVAWGYTPAVAIESLDDYIFGGYNSLDHIYGNYIGKKVTTGLLSADFNIQYRKWFALGVQFNAVAISNTEISSISNQAIGKFTDYALSLIPYARFTYMNRETVKLYSSIGLGLGFNHDAVPQSHIDGQRNHAATRFQFVPFGIMAGRRIYGLAELGLGTEYMGFRIGAGYRF